MNLNLDEALSQKETKHSRGWSFLGVEDEGKGPVGALRIAGNVIYLDLGSGCMNTYLCKNPECTELYT